MVTTETTTVFTKEWPAHGATATEVDSGDSLAALASSLDHVKLFKSKTFPPSREDISIANWSN